MNFMNKAKNFVKIGPCNIPRSTCVYEGAIIGKPFRRLLDGTQEGASRTILGEKVYIGYYSTVGTGSVIGSGTIIDDFSVIESYVKIGKKSLIIYRAQICNEVQIGDGCVIGGFVGERTKIGNRCRVFGKIVHSQYNPQSGWDAEGSEEEAPIIKDSSFIGFEAIIAGDLTIGYKAYVCAGAIITRDVPDFHIATGTNQTIHFSKWPGKLGKSSFFLNK